MSVAETMREKLERALSPAALEIKDESDLHRGHAGAREGGESHFRVTIVSSAFEGMGRLARQRRVNEVLKEELAGPVHALALKTLTPAEVSAKN